MARARFTDDFDYRPTKAFLIAYRAGKEYGNMKRDAVDQAVAAGKAIEIKRHVRAAAQESIDGEQTLGG